MFVNLAFDEPLSYRLESYEFRVLSSVSKGVKKEKNVDIKKDNQETNGGGGGDIDNEGDVNMNDNNNDNDNNNNDKVINNEEVANEGGSSEQGTDDEIEAVIDYVFNDNSEYGDIFNVYRIKWKGFGLTDATWEPKDHLNDAKEMIERYNQQINECNPNSSNIRNVRKSPFDNNLLHDLWNILNENGTNESNQYGVIWASEGRAFQVTNEQEFVSNFLSRNDHNVIDKNNYDSFSQRMTVLGFEQERESKLYHHPCFNQQSNKLIDFIGKNSIPLPDDDEKAALFKSRVAKEKQEQIHPVIDLALNNNDQLPPSVNDNNNNQSQQPQQQQLIGKKRPRDDTTNNNNNNKNKNEEISNYNYGLFVPIESGLDLNQCHLWTEHEVAEWIRHLPDWGNYYAAKFIENGVDGRILLEFNDLELVMKECEIQNIHKATFIYGVNMLRQVRKSGIDQMRQSQAM